ncbi:MAG: hypothetical protein OEY14_12090 [Myxococcales bacterium]|nr:hypothetical protein [Myxococcales bacterium]
MANVISIGTLVALCLSAAAPASAQWWNGSQPAQGGADPSASPPAAGSGGEALPAEVLGEEPEGTPGGWERPAGLRLLVLARDEATRELATSLLEPVGESIDPQPFTRAARHAGLRADEEAAFERFLPRFEVDLVVLAERRGRGRSAPLRLTYRSGRDGSLLLESEHAQGRTAREAAPRIVREARLAARADRGPSPSSAGGSGGAPSDGGLDDLGEPLFADAPAGAEGGAQEGESRSSVGVLLLGGLGIGSLEAEIAGPEGVRRLSLDSFLVVDSALHFLVQPRAEAWYTLRVGMSYRSSIGLGVADLRGDGSIREASARVQRFEALASLEAMLISGAKPVWADLELGWGLRLFDSPAELSFPDRTLTGPLLRAIAHLTLWERGLSLGAGAELHSLITVSRSLRERGVATSLWALGWTASASYPLGDVAAAELCYRESHAWLPIVNGNTGYDRERFITLRLRYRP